MAGIEVISSSLVGKSSNATSMSRLELTAFDVRLLLIDPVQRALFFHKPQRQNFIPHLKNSLSRALDFFPPLAGRLATTSNDDGTTTFFVDCNNAGAEFTHAVAASLSISDILDPKYVPEIMPSFFVLNGSPNYEGVSKPLLGVQITELADGLVIACTANHVVVDGISFWHFVNSWSEISRGLDTISKSPVFDRCLSTAIRLPPLEKHLLRSSVSPPLLERVFHFRKESLAKLKAKANSEAGTDRISTLQALSAHLWRSCVRCRPLSSSGQEVRFMMAVGARSRIPLPDGYFGNAVYAARTAISEGELLEKGLGSAASKINEIVGTQTKEMAVKLLEDWIRNPILPVKGDLSFMITSSPRHNVYGNDFGWGKPIAVRSGKAQKFDGKVTVFPAAGDGGLDAELNLAPEVLQAMECDVEFMEAFIV
nr:anthocyanin acyltransferase [Ocimum tenuiflorum]